MAPLTQPPPIAALAASLRPSSLPPALRSLLRNSADMRSSGVFVAEVKTADENSLAVLWRRVGHTSRFRQPGSDGLFQA